MKKVVRPFVVEYRSKRGKSRTSRSSTAFPCADQSAERIFTARDTRAELSAWRALFKQEARSP